MNNKLYVIELNFLLLLTCASHMYTYTYMGWERCTLNMEKTVPWSLKDACRKAGEKTSERGYVNVLCEAGRKRVTQTRQVQCS